MLVRPKFVLASSSPRRKHLLATLGIPFEVRVPDVEESMRPSENEVEFVGRLATEKAQAVADVQEDALILGADTVVMLSGIMLGKPDDENHAKSMLRQLSGKTHTVLTGIAVVHPATSRIHTAVERTDVTFDNLSDLEIERYVRSGSPMDKAGAYGIQDDHGALFVASVTGDFYNVVGLPLRTLYRLLKSEYGDLFVADPTE